MSAKEIADEWFIGRKTRVVRDKNQSMGLGSIKSPIKGKLKKGFGVKNLVAASKKHPEVVVKITTSKSTNSKGLKGVRGHLDYISREGKLQLNTSDCFKTNNKEEVHDLAKSWGRQNGIPEVSTYKEAYNFILSMPEGTDPKKVEAATKAFAERNFSGSREYAYVLHEDTDDPHVHLCVLAKDQYGQRLNPKKADLHIFRVQFAEELRKLGVDCAATKRQHRGKLEKGEKQAIIHMRKNGRLNLDKQKIQDLVQAIKEHQSPNNPLLKIILEKRKILKEDYAAISKALYKEGYKTEASAISKLNKSLDEASKLSKDLKAYEASIKPSTDLSPDNQDNQTKKDKGIEV
jgi:hypothetical protein